MREAIRYDDIKAKIKEDRKNRKKHASFLFAFRGEKPVTEYVKDMLLGRLKKVPVPALPTEEKPDNGETHVADETLTTETTETPEMTETEATETPDKNKTNPTQ